MLFELGNTRDASCVVRITCSFGTISFVFLFSFFYFLFCHTRLSSKLLPCLTTQTSYMGVLGITWPAKCLNKCCIVYPWLTSSRYSVVFVLNLKLLYLQEFLLKWLLIDTSPMLLIGFSFLHINVITSYRTTTSINWFLPQ